MSTYDNWPPEPDFEPPVLPRDITIVEDSVLMGLFGDLIAWENYYAKKVSEFDRDIDVYQSQYTLKFHEAVGTQDQSLKITERKSLALFDPAVVLVQQDLDMSKNGKRLFTVLRDSAARSSAFVSRELTRRLGRDPFEGRHQRYGTA